MSILTDLGKNYYDEIPAVIKTITENIDTCLCIRDNKLLFNS